MLFFSGRICFCQNLTTNLFIIDGLLNESFVSLENKLTILGNDKFYEIEIEEDHPDAIYLIDRFKQRFNEYRFIINENYDSSDYKIKINSVSIKPVYSLISETDISGGKLIVRNVSVSYDYEISDYGVNKVLYKDKIYKNKKDKINFDKIFQVEDARYSFAMGKLPDQSGLENYLFPAIIVAVSAAAIILFFSLRSN